MYCACPTGDSAAAKPLAQVVVPSGKDLFLEHCAQCHGDDGTGNGPMAKVLNVTPADLTSISKSANGKFPADRVAEIIRYGGGIAGHGSAVMPIWGKFFSDTGGRGRIGGAYSRRAVVELTRYLKTIQKK
jgi:mono/diheme cytochrome c family protein